MDIVKYRRKEVVDAVAWDGDQDALPQWAKDQFHHGPGCIWRDGDTLVISNGAFGAYRADIGDLVVRHENGSVCLYRAKEFEKEWERAE